MDLHRADKKPDWADVQEAHRNNWQRLAAATHGIVTIGNFLSVIGLLSVPFGLLLVVKYDLGILGATTLALGRLCDLLDGWLADKTGTKSPLGELLDATFDKVSVFVTVLVLLAVSKIPLWMVLILVLPHILVALVALLAYFRQERLHVSRLGKISMGLGWAFLLLWITTITGFDLYRAGPLGDALTIAGMLALGLSVVTGLVSLFGYLRGYAGRKASLK